MTSRYHRLLQAACLFAALAFAGAGRAAAATFTVINTDSGGAGSLRQAIFDANGNAGPDRIEFNIPGGGVQSIAPTSGLPLISEAVVVDGFTQPGSNSATNPPTVTVEIRGDFLAEGPEPGIVIFAQDDAVVIRGLAINRGFSEGIEMFDSRAVTIEGCYIGTDAGGTQDLGVNNNGISVESASDNVVIGGALPNYIAGNGANGIFVEGCENARIQGNRIGVQSDNASALGNDGHGIALDFFFFANGALVGGTTAGQGNIIGFNGGDGVSLLASQSPSDQVRILGNDIFSNTGLGIDLDDDGVTLNDAGDVDTGTNELFNFPVLQTATINPAGTMLTVAGWARPGSSIELFLGDMQAAGVFGEGRFLTRFDEGGGSDTDATSSLYSGVINGVNQGTDTTNRFSVSVALPMGVTAGTFLTGTATAGNRTSEFSATVRVVGNAVSLSYTQQPTDAVAGAAIAPAVGLELLDAVGQRVTHDSSTQVALAIQTNPPGDGVLSGTTPVTATNGTVSYADLSIDKAGTGYRLRATATGVSAADSSLFNITAGGADRLAFVQQPTDTVAGVSISPAVAVRIEDALGNLVLDNGTPITLAIGNNPGGGTLAGTLSQNTVSGVATFGDLSINLIGTGYTLAASAPSLTGATSAPFNITAAAANRLAFVQQPTDTVAGDPISPSVTVGIEDQFGNPVTTTGTPITLAIGNNPGGGTLSGTLTQNTVNGVSTFADLSIDKAGTAYTLTAASAGLTGATSDPFDITVGAANRLAFVQQPTDTVAGASISPAVTVRIEDAEGNSVTADGTPITLAIGTNPSGGTLSGTLTQNSVSGVATFAGLSIDLVGTGYTLTAASTGLTGATSDPFNITAASANKLSFVQQPTDTVAGANISPAVTVRVEDQFGNTVTVDGTPITLAISTNPAAGTLSGTLTQNTVAGVATFADLSIDKAGVGYRLAASSTGLTSATSDLFDITSAAANRLIFVQQPSDTVAGVTIAPAVTVRIEDAFGNVVAADGTAITLAIGTNPSAGTLSGTPTRNSVSGLSTFADISIDAEGMGYTLVATSPGITSATSDPFNILAANANRLVFGQQPTDTASGSPITPAVTVRIEDSLGNLVVVDGTPITLAIDTNPSDGTLSGTLIQNSVGGIATFADLSIDLVGVGYTLRATSSGLQPAVSDPFNITGGAAARLVFVQQPTDTEAGQAITPAVTVRLEDAAGNPLPTDGVAIALAIDTNPGSGTLSGTLTQNTAAGVATFAGLSIDQPGTGYTLEATSTGLPAAISDPFNITLGSLAFVQQPTDTVARQAIRPSVTVRLLDGAGDPLTTDGVAIALAIGTNPSGGTLSGTLTQNTVAGVATFADLAIEVPGTGYTLVASSVGLPDATSDPFNILTLPAVQLAFVQQPTDTVVDQKITPSVTVRLENSAGSLVQTNGVAITLAIGTNPASGTLNGTLTQNTAAGVATFPDLSIDMIGDGYTLVASSPSLTDATSNAFNILLVPIGSQTLTADPTSVPADGTSTSTLTITLFDGGGNPLAGIDPARLGITFTPTGGVTVTGPTTATDANGQTTATTSRSAAGTVNYTLQIDGADTAATATVEFIFVRNLSVNTDVYFIGFPVQQGTGSPLETLGADGAWRVGRWDQPSDDYVLYVPATDSNNPLFYFPRGTGHYVRWDFARTLMFAGDAPDTEIAVPLTVGWTTLGNPFTTILPWTLDQFTIRETATGNVLGTLADHALWDTVRPYCWRLNRTTRLHELVFPVLGAADELQVYDGFWMYALQPGLEVVLTPPEGLASRSHHRQAEPTASQWSAEIVALAGDQKSNVIVGVDGQLTRAMPIEAAPGLGESRLDMRLVTPTGRYAGELDRPSNRQEWELAATSADGGPVTLSWPKLGRSMPQGVLLSIEDLQNGQRTALNGHAAYSYTAAPGQERRFRLVAEPFGNQRTTITDLRGTTSRAAGSSFSLTLSGPAKVTVSITGLGGRLVRTLREEATEAGTIAIAWDGRDANGRAVPAGTYRAEAVAEGPLGLSNRTVRTIVIQ